MYKLKFSNKLIVLFLFAAIAILVGQVTIVTPAKASPAIDALIPTGSFTPAAYGVPDSIAGHKVLAVISSDNTACVPTGTKWLVAQTNEPSEMDFLSRIQPSAINKEVEALNLTKSTKTDIKWAGPGVTLDQIVTETKKWNRSIAKSGCFRLTSLVTGTDGSNLNTASPSPGWALVEDTNAGLYTDDDGQAITLIAPTIGTNQTAYISFLNNVKSNTDFFMQNGFAFTKDGRNTVNWTDTTVGMVAQDYGMAYVAGHNYTFTISRSSGVWFYCARDNNTSQYLCQQSSGATGTHMKADLNTSIWVENWNASPSNWYSGFSSQFRAYNARLYRNGVGQAWSAQHRHTAEACPAAWPVANVISGSLVNSASLYFTLTGVPLKC